MGPKYSQQSSGPGHGNVVCLLGLAGLGPCLLDTIDFAHEISFLRNQTAVVWLEVFLGGGLVLLFLFLFCFGATFFGA